jgi:hypothetical protein
VGRAASAWLVGEAKDDCLGGKAQVTPQAQRLYHGSSSNNSSSRSNSGRFRYIYNSRSRFTAVTLLTDIATTTIGTAKLTPTSAEAHQPQSKQHPVW